MGRVTPIPGNNGMGVPQSGALMGETALIGVEPPFTGVLKASCLYATVRNPESLGEGCELPAGLIAFLSSLALSASGEGPPRDVLERHETAELLLFSVLSLCS